MTKAQTVTKATAELAFEPEHGKNAVATRADDPGAAALPAIQDGAPNSLLPAIIQLCVDPRVDADKLERLLKMQADMEKRQAERDFIEAFSRLSADMPQIQKNGTISLVTKEGQNKGNIPFARWEDMDTVIRPRLAAEGFTLSFDSVPRTVDGGGLIVTGTLMHKGGHTRTASMPLALDTGPGRNNLQAMGSTLAYGKRYCSEMLLNLVRRGTDDDGKLGGTEFLKPEQVAELQKLLEETKSDTRSFCELFNVDQLSDISQGAFAAAKNMLMHKKSKKGSAS